jgi:Alpha-glucosidases, family 31 of glycosyl hydrolases
MSKVDIIPVAENGLMVSFGNHRTLSFREVQYNGKCKITLKVGERITFSADGEEILLDLNREISPDGHLHHTMKMRGTGFYGLGQHPGFFNYEGREVTLTQRNGEIGIPFLLSNHGVGVIWDLYSMSRVRVGRSNGWAQVDLWAEEVDGLNYYVIYGPSPDDIIRTYRELSGGTPMLPRWAFGYWQSKERYASQSELMEVVEEFKRRNIPLDVIVQDWMYWGKYGWNAMKFDESNYPNVKEATRRIHELGVHAVISVWPNFGQQTEVLGRMYPHLIPGSLNYDPSSEEGRLAYWNEVRKLLDMGFDGLWLDASEPELFKPTGGDRGTYTFYSGLRDSTLKVGKGSSYLNAYPYLHSVGIYENWRKSFPTRPVILTRSAYLGQHVTGAIVWSGDIHHDWGVLKAQIQGGLNFSASGHPYWTTDTGGFFSGDPSSESYGEIFVRWIQWSALCPIMRVHGTGYPKEPWRFKNEGVRRAIELRYSLLPYIYSLAWMVTRGYTMMRPLFMDFPWLVDVDDQYMLGPFLMVSPVTFPKVREREVYLPGGWYDFWTNEKVLGKDNETVKVKAPLERIPLHVREGSVLPLGSINGAEPMELRIYPGGNSSFDLYFDEGDGWGYESGDYQIVRLELKDGTLSISSTGKLKLKHEFKVTVLGREIKKLSYTGESTSLNYPVL